MPLIHIEKILCSPDIIGQEDNFSQSSHNSLCRQLLPYTKGWENFFLREISKLKSLSESQREKLEAIAKKCAENEASRRICRHCQGAAQNIDKFSYYCRKCGNCLNLEWGGER